MANGTGGLPALKVVGGLFGLLGWVLFMGLQRIWHYTFGWVFKTLADLLDGISVNTGLFGHIRPFGSVAAWLRSLDRNVSHALARYAAGLEHLAVWLFSRLTLAFSWLGREIKGLAGDVAAIVSRLVRVYIPRLVRGLLRFIWKELRAVGRYARRQIPALLRKFTHLFKYAKWLARQLIKLPLAFAKKLLSLQRWAVKRLIGFAKRLARLEHRLIGKRLLAAVGWALHELKLGFLFTYQWKATGHWLTKWSIGDVVEFTKDLVTFAGQTDICKLAQYQADVAHYVIVPTLAPLISLTDTLCWAGPQHLASGQAHKPGYDGSWEPSGTPATSTLTPFRRLAPGVPLPRGVIKV